MSTKIRPSAVASIPTPPEKRTLHPVAATKLNTRQRIPKSRPDTKNRSKVVSLPDRPSPAVSQQSSRPSSAVSTTSNCPNGQDIRFINIETTADHRPSTTSEPPKDGRQIVPEEILAGTYEKDYTKVYEVVCHASSISRISGLDKFTNLRILDLSCNYIEKIEQLEHNTDLRELKLYGNRIRQMENLHRLKELAHLQLQHNRITSIGKSLQHQRKLKVLRLDNNQITKLDVRELATCVQLTSLDLSNNHIDNLAALNSLPNLTELFLKSNQLSRVDDLSRCKKLQEIDLSCNSLTDLSGLKTLPWLNTLDLSHNCLTTLRTLGKHKCLQDLNVSYNKLSQVRGIPELLPRLQVLDITENVLEGPGELDLLRDLPDLCELYISGNEALGESIPHIHAHVKTLLPQLDILDGAHVGKPSTRPGTPLMRPMSASTVVSTRQIDTQLKNIGSQLNDFETNCNSRFESLRNCLTSLPMSAPGEATPCDSRPQTGRSSRSDM
ncbi:hypothetical protein NP493_99g01038 [Ridgeia piscesae]|uniref:Disease resistance R13L4/SHOC-2-like LRR domain-containing protein n=1 Tax=Ridgeia piscesae TaxID=27915 RepID=A0AAD9P7N0_RIDPI|nr:hypothetical protein NP493_99g01038 [Ridgeia piscesae]